MITLDTGIIRIVIIVKAVWADRASDSSRIVQTIPIILKSNSNKI